MLEANFEDSAMEAADNDDIALTTEDIEENDLETAVVENVGSETAYNEDAIMEAAGCEDDILEAVGSEDEEHQGWHLKDYFSPCFCLLFFKFWLLCISIIKKQKKEASHWLEQWLYCPIK